MSDEAPATFTMTLGGRDILFKRPLLGQILILQRTAKRRIAEAENDPEDEGKALTAAMIKTLDFIETLIVHEQDRQFVEDGMFNGTIDYRDLLKAMSGGQTVSETADDEAPKPVKRAVKKSPKAAKVDLSANKPAQVVSKPEKTTSRGRTKR